MNNAKSKKMTLALNSNMIWHDWSASDLNLYALYDILHLRNQVFIVEQNCPYQDIDGQDLAGNNRHIAAYQQGKMVAYSRLLAPQSTKDKVTIGRVIVAPSARGQRMGQQLMEHALQACARHWPERMLFLSAQAHLQGFYGSIGFTVCSDVYDEDGIAHIDMQLPR